ncbi:MAG TPA: hypothetical protein VLZ07_09460 [Syntrophales bacterium]|nr:hypothetical protein [Syntrophales bacterium]
MLKVSRDKDPENILREEMQQERAQVLGRAGEKLAAAIAKMRGIEDTIEERLKKFELDSKRYEGKVISGKSASLRHEFIGEINREIGRYNRAREYAKLRYYYLIVTREAMGMRRHHWVEELYRIPPRKALLRNI